MADARCDWLQCEIKLVDWQLWRRDVIGSRSILTGSVVAKELAVLELWLAVVAMELAVEAF